MNDVDRQTLGTQTAPLLDESYSHLLRALAINPGHVQTIMYLAAVKRAHCSVAATVEAREGDEEEARAWDLKGGWKGYASAATITFHQVVGERIAPQFPRDPEMLITPAPPLPRKLTIAE
jgi:hypothetical protein